MTDIESLIRDHSQKKRQESDDLQRRAVEDRVAKCECVELLKSTVLPVLRECAADIERAGYKSDVCEQLESWQPSVAIEITVSAPGLSSGSSLVFEQAGTGRIGVVARICGRKSYINRKEWQSHEVNGGKVKSATVDFVKAVLESN